MFKTDYFKIQEKLLAELLALNYVEQFLDLLPGFLRRHLPLNRAVTFILDNEKNTFVPYTEDSSLPGGAPEKITPDSHLVTYLKSAKRILVLKDEPPARLQFLEKSDPLIFQFMPFHLVVPLFTLEELYGFVLIDANPKTFKELPAIEHFFKILSHTVIPMLAAERIQLEHSRNYYKIYRMDRLALVGELAASAAHEIKNPLAGISTFLKYFSQLDTFTKEDILEELKVMKDSVRRIDDIVKSFLSFSRFKRKKIEPINLVQIIEATLQSIALKIPAHIDVSCPGDEGLVIDSDFQQLQQVLINILFNAVEAIGAKPGAITIEAYVTGMDRLPRRELYIISIRDTGPGFPPEFKEKIFQPFQTTKEEGTGLGLYTCYGLMKSLGGDIRINSDSRGSQVILALPRRCDDANGET